MQAILLFHSGFFLFSKHFKILILNLKVFLEARKVFPLVDCVVYFLNCHVQTDVCSSGSGELNEQ